MNRTLLCLALSCVVGSARAQPELRRYEVFPLGPHGIYDSDAGPNDSGEFLIKENGRIRFWSPGTRTWHDISADFPRLASTSLGNMNNDGLVSGNVWVNGRRNTFVYDVRNRSYCEPSIANDVVSPLIDHRGDLGGMRNVDALVHDRPFGQCTGGWTRLDVPSNTSSVSVSVPRMRDGSLPIQGLVNQTQAFAGFATRNGFVPAVGVNRFEVKNAADQCLVGVTGYPVTWALWQNGQLGSRRWNNPWASGLTDRGEVIQRGTQFGAINYELATDTSTTQLAALIDDPRLHWLRGGVSAPGTASMWGFGSFTTGRNDPFERIMLRAKPGATLAINVSGSTIGDHVGEPLRVPLTRVRLGLTVQGGQHGNRVWIYAVDASGRPWLEVAAGSFGPTGEFSVEFAPVPASFTADLRAYSLDARGNVFGLPILDSPTRRIEVR